ncbi:DNA-binding response regulator [Nakamurella silvestris]|nr:DNA-binding response regulator [Nakamurella silvestris]
MPKILLVEDDPKITLSLVDSLTESGYTVLAFNRGAAVLGSLLHSEPDLILLDLGLPDMEGATVLSMVRAVSAVPVIVITARRNEEQIVRLLDLGADDYVAKPFTMVQLGARIRAVLRRTGSAVPQSIDVGEVNIDTKLRRASLAGRLLDLRPREYQLLLTLATSQGQVLTSTEVASRIWGDDVPGADGRLDALLSILRSKMGESATNPVYLHRVRGMGIRLAAPE